MYIVLGKDTIEMENSATYTKSKMRFSSNSFMGRDN